MLAIFSLGGNPDGFPLTLGELYTSDAVPFPSAGMFYCADKGKTIVFPLKSFFRFESFTRDAKIGRRKKKAR